MSDTIENLKAAFAGEAQASRRYTAFAKKADSEGYSQVAKLFRAAALSESIHAINHLNALGAIASTDDNLRAAIAGENYEVVNMYPGFIQTAESEENKKARNIILLGDGSRESPRGALQESAGVAGCSGCRN